MKKYTPLDGLRWSRNSDSALNNMPQTDVLGRAGGVNAQFGHLSDFFYKILKQISCKDTKFK